MPSTLLVVADSLEGGLGAAALSHVRWFAARGWKVVAAAPEASAGVPERFEAVALPATARDVRRMWRAARQLRAVHRSLSPSVVHCHGLRSFAATRAAGIRAFVTVHTDGSVPSDPAGYAWLRRVVRARIPLLAAGAISAAPDVAGWRFLVHASPRLQDLELVPFPGAVDERPMFLWLGFLDERKAGDEFVRAIADLACRRSVSGVVAGRGPGLDRLQAMATDLGAPVAFVGHQEPAPLLARAWGLCLFSRQEAVTFAAQEAMWTGRSVVASPLPGLRWLVGDTGALSDDVSEVSAALERLCDRGRAEDLGRRAADRVRSLIRPDDPWPAVADLYAKALA